METVLAMTPSYWVVPGIPEPKVRVYEGHEIVGIVCADYALTPNRVKAKTRRREVVEARYMCYKFLKERTSLSLTAIGDLMGGFDHATVLHGLTTIENLIETNKSIHDTYQRILRRFAQQPAHLEP